MTRRPYPFIAGATLLLLSSVFIACGSSQSPAESPEQAPPAEEAAPGESTDAGPGEHVMPDGTVMPGEHHEGDASAPEGEQHQH